MSSLDETTGYQTVEVPCQRQVGAGNFAGSLQDFQFSVSHPNVWVPSHSYFVLELEVLGGGDPATATQPKINETLALAESCCGNLYTNAYVYGGGQVLSSIVQSLPQINALNARLNNTWAFSQSIGAGTMATKGSFSDRCAAISTGEGASKITGDDIQEIYRPTAAGNYSASTVSIDAATGVVTGIESNFPTEAVGSTLVVEGVSYKVISHAGALAMTVTPKPTADVAATTEWYLVKRDTKRTLQARNKVQLVWRPPLGVFQTDALMGPGSYRITLSPDANFKFAGVETINPDYNGVGANSAYTLNILDVNFYAAMAQRSIPDGVQPPLHLMEYSAFSKTMQSNQGQFQFTVPPSTEEMFIFIQSPSAGLNPLYPPSKFAGVNDSDLNLQSIQVSYGGQTKPQTRWESGFKSQDPAGRNKAFLAHLYYQGLLETERAHDQGGAESLTEFLQRGAFFGFRFDRDATARDTDVQVQIQYADADGGPFDPNSKIYLIAKHRAVRQLTISNGQITSVVGIDG